MDKTRPSFLWGGFWVFPLCLVTYVFNKEVCVPHTSYIEIFLNDSVEDFYKNIYFHEIFFLLEIYGQFLFQQNNKNIKM